MQFIIYQCWVLLASLLCGIILGLLFDFYRNFSRRWRKKAIVLGLFDFLFWLVAWALLFAFWYFLTPGGTRLLLIFFLLVGFVIYHAYLRMDFSRLPIKNCRSKGQKIAQLLSEAPPKGKKGSRKMLLIFHWPGKAFSDAFYGSASAFWDLGLKSSAYSKKLREKLQKPSPDEDKNNEPEHTEEDAEEK